MEETVNLSALFVKREDDNGNREEGNVKREDDTAQANSDPFPCYGVGLFYFIEKEQQVLQLLSRYSIKTTQKTPTKIVLTGQQVHSGTDDSFA